MPRDSEGNESISKSANIVASTRSSLASVDIPRDSEGHDNISKSTDLVASTNSKSHLKKSVFCYYCEMEVLNFPRHITRNHKSELDVQKIISLPQLSKERKNLLFALRKKGNYLKSNKDSSKPVRKGNENTSYLPCIHCLGYYSSKSLWRHRKICDANPNKGGSAKNTKAEAQNYLIRNLKIDPQLRMDVFPRMRADQVSLVAKKDALICAFASRYLKIHREKHFILVASRKMRELARLLLEVKMLKPSITSLYEALKPDHYDTLVSATKAVGRYDPECKSYKSPTIALNMGTTLKQCCDIALVHALKKSQELSTINSANQEADLKTLMQLIIGNWKFDVSSQAASDLNIQKWNKVTLVPLANDLKLLKDCLINKANDALSNLENNSKNEKSYNILLETIYCRIILLNRRRPGELQRIFVNTYKSLILNENPQGYEEFGEVISETEKILMNSFKRIVIRGKRGRGVPVLISRDVQEHLDVILKYRDGILTKPNNYLFANPRSCEPIIGYKVLRKYATLSGAKNPDALTCTRLRKHLATLTQLFNMSENDMEQLASFMGHTLSIHRKSYRLPDDIYQTSRISKLLLLMEKGEAGQFKGKSLDEINLNLEENLLDMPEDDLATTENNFQDTKSLKDNEKRIRNPRNVVDGESEKHDLDSNISKESKKRTLVPWTSEQKKIVTNYFKNHIKKKCPPKRAECDNLISEHAELLKNKNWLKIKVFVQNQYTKK